MGQTVRGPRILVVEDEVLTGLWIVQVVEERGWAALPVTTLDAALTLLHSERLDGALLDINLHGLSIEPVMDVLCSRGIPYAVITARVPPQIRPRLGSVTVIDKPCSRFEIGYALDSLFSEPQGGQGGREGNEAPPDDIGPGGPLAAAPLVP